MPHLALRTTFIVGYPGETDAEFDTLISFIKDMNFDRVGAFIYSFEPDTPGAPLGDPIPAEIKEERQKTLMLAQEKISLAKNQSFIGKRLDVLIEGIDWDQNLSIGRSYRDAPEIDGLVIVNGTHEIGEFTRVEITDAYTHDLAGMPVE